jgi:hypothetical protein
LQEYHRKYILSLHNFIKTILKGKVGREPVMRFLAACVVSNTNRAKLGHNVQDNAMKKMLSAISSDAFCFNALHIMNEFSLPFLDLSKDMWKKIDPTYLPSGVRIDLTGETPICASRDSRQPLTFPKEFGTISEFYFMEVEMVHFGLMHIIKKYRDIKRIMDKLKQDLKAHEGNKQAVEKIEEEIKKFRTFRMAYELCLCDNHLAKLLEKLYTVHIQLLKNWGMFDAKEVCFGGKHANLFCYLPENFIADLIDAFSDILKTNPREFKAFLPETVV